MDMVGILTALKLRPGLQDAADRLLEDMIRDCMEEIRDVLNYAEGEDIPAGLAGVVKDLVCLRYNRDGLQGIQSESQSSGGSTTYLQDIPADMKRRIYRYRRLRR